jgi:hypothetical protein
MPCRTSFGGEFRKPFSNQSAIAIRASGAGLADAGCGPPRDSFHPQTHGRMSQLQEHPTQRRVIPLLHYLRKACCSA